MSTPIVSKEPENKVSTEVLGKEHTTTQENIANTTESTKMSSTPKDGTVKESGSPKSKSADQRKEAVPLTSAGQVVKKQTLGKPVISTSDEDEDDDDSQTHADDRLYKTVTGADGKPKKIFGDPTSSNFILNDPDGNTYYVQRLIPFCKKHKLLSSEIYKVCTGRFRQHRVSSPLDLCTALVLTAHVRVGLVNDHKIALHLPRKIDVVDLVHISEPLLLWRRNSY